MAFRLYTGNRLESLAELLVCILKEPQENAGSSLFPKEVIVVQSKGMERWLSFKIAEATGISANISFPFPKSFIFGELFPEVSGMPMPVGADPFDPETMAWKIMRLLPGLVDADKDGTFKAPAAYLDGDRGNIKLYQLSNRIAGVFDQYMVYRPEMILGGFKDEDADRARWQKMLFEEIVSGCEQHLPSMRCREFIERLDSAAKKDSGGISFRKLPRRIFIFGISVLPPLYIDIFKALSGKIEVNFFSLTPCERYWGDIVPEKKLLKIAVRRGKDAAELHYETAHPLLASMGKYGGDFHWMITEKLSGLEAGALFSPPDGDSILSMLQRDMLELPEKSAARGADTDLNIQFHSCYNPMREVEVLYDNLLKLIEEKGVEPKDILVVTPDIASYAPFIKAVFDSAEKEPGSDFPKKYIPHSIADRTVSSESPVFKAFLGIIDLGRTRFSAPSLIDILDTDGVRDCFGISESEVSDIKTWLAESGVRWGIDAENRKSFGLPAFDEGSWKAGLDRMLLGFALGTEENKDCFTPQGGGRIFPYPKIEEGAAATLGRLAEFTGRIFDFGRRLETPRSLSGWSEFLGEIIRSFFRQRNDNRAQMVHLWRIVRRFGALQEASGYDAEISLDIIRACLAQSFEKERNEGGFMSCGVTFCELLPMRSIPFKVVCMIGMNDGGFPRQSRRAGFDLMADKPRRCDRDPRFEDKYLFLEALVSAREFLYVSYTGRSMQDNKPLPPSVCVSDLLDLLVGQYGCRRDEIFTEHPLQAFSYRNFLQKRDSKIFSHSHLNYEAAAELLSPAGKKSVHVFWPADRQPTALEKTKSLGVDALVAFFKNPPKSFLKNSLKIRLDDSDEAELDEREIFELDNLAAYAVNQEIVAARIKDDASTEFQIGGKHFLDISAKGLLPPEPFASATYKKSLDGIRPFVEKFKEIVSGLAPAEPVPVDIEVGSLTRLRGKLLNIYRGGETVKQVFCFYVSKRAKYRLDAWIYHLAACASGNRAETCMLIGKDQKSREVVTFAPISRENAIKELKALLSIYEEGCSRPIPFFPDTSHSFVDALKKGSAAAMKKAQSEYEPKDFSGAGPSESEDPYIRYCFTESLFEAPELEQYLQEFVNLALAVFGPLEEAVVSTKKEGGAGNASSPGSAPETASGGKGGGKGRRKGKGV